MKLKNFALSLFLLIPYAESKLIPIDKLDAVVNREPIFHSDVQNFRQIQSGFPKPAESKLILIDKLDAVVNREPIFYSDVQNFRQIQSGFPKPLDFIVAGEENFLDNLINVKLIELTYPISEDHLSVAFNKNPKVLQDDERCYFSKLESLKLFFQQEIVSQIPQQEKKRLFGSKNLYSYHLGKIHLVAPDQKKFEEICQKAQEILKKLREGELFDKIANEIGQDSWNLDEIHQDNLEQRILKKIKNLKENELILIKEPSTYSVDILKILKKTEVPSAPQEVSSEVYQKPIKEAIEKKRKTAAITIVDEEGLIKNEY